MGDEAEARAEEASDAAGSGDFARLDLALERLWTADASVAQILRGAMGHFQRLASVRESVNRGESLETAMKRLRPPVHFLREQSFKAQANRWNERKAGRRAGHAAGGGSPEPHHRRARRSGLRPHPDEHRRPGEGALMLPIFPC